MLQCSVCSSSIIQLKKQIHSNKQIKILKRNKENKIEYVPGQKKRKKSGAFASSFCGVSSWLSFLCVTFDRNTCGNGSLRTGRHLLWTVFETTTFTSLQQTYFVQPLCESCTCVSVTSKASDMLNTVAICTAIEWHIWTLCRWSVAKGVCFRKKWEKQTETRNTYLSGLLARFPEDVCL